MQQSRFIALKQIGGTKHYLKKVFSFTLILRLEESFEVQPKDLIFIEGILALYDEVLTKKVYFLYILSGLET